ncbi:MAG TPA: cobalamin-dependent protein, partial [Aminivibrio sp.]|nr:cobalamin-dependent protein [Aminivibrio sp.]
MNILIQLLRQKKYTAEMFQGYAKEALSHVKMLMEQEDRPKVIGFYCDFDNVHWVRLFAREVKRNYPEVILLAGGPQTVDMDADFLKDTGILAVCIGEGEETVPELMEYCIHRRGSLETIQGIAFLDASSQLVKTPPRTPPEALDSIPWP